MARFIPAALLGLAHLVVHFTVPLLDLMLHGAFFASLYFGVKNVH